MATKVRLLFAALGVGAASLTACAHSVPAGGSASAPSGDVSMAAGPRWTARLASVMQSRGDIRQSTQDKSYGSAEWRDGDAVSLSKVDLVFTYSGNERDLSWAILPGACGSASLPLLPLSNFPELNLVSGGRAQITVTLPIDLPVAGTYHIDIYRDRLGGTESVVGCGNLKYLAG